MTGFLLDTNVISELRKPKPNRGLRAWIEKVPEPSLYLSSLTIGEVRAGVESVNDARKRRDLDRWLLGEVRPRFRNRILSFDDEVADRWGRLEAHMRLTGKALPIVDGILAATALHYDLSLVTRNERDFVRAGVRVVNPWE